MSDLTLTTHPLRCGSKPRRSASVCQSGLFGLPDPAIAGRCREPGQIRYLVMRETGVKVGRRSLVLPNFFDDGRKTRTGLRLAKGGGDIIDAGTLRELGMPGRQRLHMNFVQAIPAVVGRGGRLGERWCTDPLMHRVAKGGRVR